MNGMEILNIIIAIFNLFASIAIAVFAFVQYLTLKTQDKRNLLQLQTTHHVKLQDNWDEFTSYLRQYIRGYCGSFQIPNDRSLALKLADRLKREHKFTVCYFTPELVEQEAKVIGAICDLCNYANPDVTIVSSVEIIDAIFDDYNELENMYAKEMKLL